MTYPRLMTEHRYQRATERGDVHDSPAGFIGEAVPHQMRPHAHQHRKHDHERSAKCRMRSAESSFQIFQASMIRAAGFSNIPSAVNAYDLPYPPHHQPDRQTEQETSRKTVGEFVGIPLAGHVTGIRTDTAG